MNAELYQTKQLCADLTVFELSGGVRNSNIRTEMSATA